MTELEAKKAAYLTATDHYRSCLAAYTSARGDFTDARQRQQRLETDMKFDRFPHLTTERDALASLAALRQRIPQLRRMMDDALLQADDALTEVHHALRAWQDAVAAHNDVALAQQRGEVEVAVGPLMAALMEIDSRPDSEILDCIMSGFKPRRPVDIATADAAHLPDADVIRYNAAHVRGERERSRPSGLQTAPVDPLHEEVRALRRAAGY